MNNFFKDKSGNVVIGEKPNLPLVVWFVAMVISKIPSIDIIANLSSLIAFGAIFTWAWMELFDGTNMFRRTLGLIVLIVTISLKI